MQTPKSKHVRKGEIALKYFPYTLVEDKQSDITTLSNVQFFCRSRIQVVDKIFVLVTVEIAASRR